MLFNTPQGEICSSIGCLLLRCVYLDGSGQVRFLLAEVEEPGDRHSIGQIVDKGHVVDQVVHLSNAQDDNGGNALREMKGGRVTKKGAEYLRHVLCVSARVCFKRYRERQYLRRAAGRGLGCSFLGES